MPILVISNIVACAFPFLPEAKFLAASSSRLSIHHRLVQLWFNCHIEGKKDTACMERITHCLSFCRLGDLVYLHSSLHCGEPLGSSLSLHTVLQPPLSTNRTIFLLVLHSERSFHSEPIESNAVSKSGSIFSKDRED